MYFVFPATGYKSVRGVLYGLELFYYIFGYPSITSWRNQSEMLTGHVPGFHPHFV